MRLTCIEVAGSSLQGTLRQLNGISVGIKSKKEELFLIFEQGETEPFLLIASPSSELRTMARVAHRGATDKHN